MRQGPKHAPAERRQIRADRRRVFHTQRIATAPTPEHLVEAVRDRVRALMAAAPADRRHQIASRVADALNRIADEEEARLS